MTYKANNEAHAEAWKCALEKSVEIAKKYEGIRADSIDEFSQVLSRALLSSLVHFIFLEASLWSVEKSRLFILKSK